MSEALGHNTAPSEQLWGCTDTKLHQLSRLMSRHYDAELAKVGLRATQFSLLTEVLMRDPVRPSELAEAMGLDPSTVTRNLKPLLSAGWLEQGPGTDGRTRAIRITASGRKKCAEGVPHWRTAEAKIDGLFGSRNASELDTVIRECLEIMSMRESGQLP